VPLPQRRLQGKRRNSVNAPEIEASDREETSSKMVVIVVIYETAASMSATGPPDSRPLPRLPTVDEAAVIRRVLDRSSAAVVYQCPPVQQEPDRALEEALHGLGYSEPDLARSATAHDSLKVQQHNGDVVAINIDTN